MCYVRRRRDDSAYVDGRRGYANNSTVSRSVILKLCIHCGKHYDPATGVRNRCGPCGRAYDQRHSVERRARNSAKWQQARAAARKRDGERCRQCGSTDRLQVHHIKPLAEGGDKYALENLMTLCHDCHVRVGGRSGIERQTSSHPAPGIRERNERKILGPQSENRIEPLVG